MNFFSAVFFLSSAFLFFSCSNAADEKTQESGFETLKAESEFIASKIIWTEEIEGGRLTGKIKASGLGNKVKPSVLSLSAKKNEKPFVYPSINDFGSLDTTLIPLNLKAALEKFSGLISSGGDFSSLVRHESLAETAIFFYDLNSYLPEYFDFFNSKAEKSAENSNKENDEMPAENENQLFFDSFIFGEPFIDGVNYDVPFRFFSENKILTLETYWAVENSKWMLDQIQIRSVEDSAKEKS